jgi:hypothetical protein
MHAAMYTYAWDLAEEGVDRVAGRLQDAGIDTVTLATSYHAGKFLRPHAPGRKVYFPEDGTVYFRPDHRRYGRIKPRVNTMVAKFDALRVLEREAPDMRRVGWTVGLHNTPLGLIHPDLVATTVFGDPLFNSLCPAQPEVREFLVALCADLGASYAPSEIAIETPGWQAFRHGHHHEFELIALTPRVEIMLGTCFCAACRAGAHAAGIDVEGLASRTRADLEGFFASGTEPAIDPETDADWQALAHWRAGAVTSLVAEVRAALDRRVGLAIIPTTQSPNALCWIEGSDLASLARVADRLEVPAYRTGVDQIAVDAADVRRRAGKEARLGFILRPSHPNLHDAGEVAAAVDVIRRLDVDSIAFYNFGHVRLQSLDWVGAALSRGASNVPT